MVIVLAPDPRVARWCAEPIDLDGLGKSIMRPLVVGPDHVPIVTDPREAERLPALSVLSVIAHGKTRFALDVGRAGLHAAGTLDEEDDKLYADLILHHLDGAARAALERERMALKLKREASASMSPHASGSKAATRRSSMRSWCVRRRSRASTSCSRTEARIAESVLGVQDEPRSETGGERRAALPCPREVPCMLVLTLSQIRAALAAHEPRRMPEPRNIRNRACVALVFAGAPEALSLCFIRRTEREDDPWSGHMALPGGRSDATDPTPQFTALRETSEEVGLVLEPDALLGPLNQVPMRRIVRSDSVLCPFAFYWGRDLPELQPEETEAEEAYWISLNHLWDPGNLTTLDFEHEGRSMTFPGIAWGEQVIWGLTHRVLTDFARTLGTPLPAETPAP